MCFSVNFCRQMLRDLFIGIVLFVPFPPFVSVIKGSEITGKIKW